MKKFAGFVGAAVVLVAVAHVAGAIAAKKQEEAEHGVHASL